MEIIKTVSVSNNKKRKSVISKSGKKYLIDSFNSPIKSNKDNSTCYTNTNTNSNSNSTANLNANTILKEISNGSNKDKKKGKKKSLVGGKGRTSGNGGASKGGGGGRMLAEDLLGFGGPHNEAGVAKEEDRQSGGEFKRVC